MLTIYENDLYLLSETKNAISLIYEDRSGAIKLRMVRGRVYKWKKSVIKYLSENLKVNGEIRSYNIGSRISVLIRILPDVDNRRDAYKIADLIYMMGVEEVAFWSWKINERKKDAVRSFLVMYGFR